MHKQRFERLIEIAKDIPVEQFDMHTFCNKTDCGTTYCLAGWAGLDPELNKQGFFLRQFQKGPGFPTYGLWAGAFAVENFFAITEEGYKQVFLVDKMGRYLADPKNIKQYYVNRLIAFYEAHKHES